MSAGMQNADLVYTNIQLYPNMRHEPLHEKDHQTVYQDILEWIEDNTADVC